MEITSVNNEYVKECSKLLQKKYRNQTNKFIIEGYKAIKEAHDFGIEIEKVFVERGKLNEYDFISDKIIETNEAVLKKISDVESCPQAVAIAVQKHYDKTLLSKYKKVLLLENIKDAGNLGTIIRSSVAFGVDAIILYGDSVDIYNPKCVRSAVGNLWKIPIFNIKDFSQLKEIFNNFERIATLPRSKNYLKDFVFKSPSLIMFGSEADGLSEELVNFSTNSVKIEMAQTVESLNLATSVSIILYKSMIS